MNQIQAIPLAYFITFTCYGTWLHGARETSVDKTHNVKGTPFLSRNAHRAQQRRSSMKEAPYLLDPFQRDIVLKSIINVCNYSNWGLLAAHVRTNHVHIVLQSFAKPEQVLNKIKAYASRELNMLDKDKARKMRWTRHGSTLYLWVEAEVEAAIKYVIEEQGVPMSFFENKKRVLILV